jgi:hypothetical protein
VRGDTLSGYWAGEFLSGGAADQCHTLTAPDAEAGCLGGSMAIYDDAGMHCALPAGPATLVGASGWSLPLSFVQPTMEQHETDVWVDRSAALTEGGRCTVTTADRCVDGPATKTIDGRAVTRACWSYERTLTCASGAPVDECAPLASSGCTPATSTCKQLNAATGLCEITQDTYTCPVSAQTATTASDCPANVYCLGSNCFNTSYTNDADFARSMSLMEAAREAGVYLDTDNMQVFKGESNKCRDRLFKNCCYSDSAGAGMTNQSLFGTGSRLVYDVLMNADNREFLYQGMQALLLERRLFRQLHHLRRHRRGQWHRAAGRLGRPLCGRRSGDRLRPLVAGHRSGDLHRHVHVLLQRGGRQARDEGRCWAVPQGWHLVLVVHPRFRQVRRLHRAHHRQVLLQQQARAHRQRAGPRASGQGLGLRQESRLLRLHHRATAEPGLCGDGPL